MSPRTKDSGRCPFFPAPPPHTPQPGWLDTFWNQCEHFPPILLTPHMPCLHGLLQIHPIQLTSLGRHPYRVASVAHTSCKQPQAETGGRHLIWLPVLPNSESLLENNAGRMPCRWVWLQPQQMDWGQSSGLTACTTQLLAHGNPRPAP